MARQTPEGRVKAKVKRLLDAYKPLIYYRMPVTNGMGLPQLDFYGSCCGLHFEIETKREGEKPTPRQMMTMGEIEASGAQTFTIAGENDPAFDVLEEWINHTVMVFHRRKGIGFDDRRH